MHRGTRLIGGIAAAFVLAACGTAAGGSERKTWVPKPSFQGEGQVPGVSPAVPGPGGAPNEGGSSGTTPTPSTTKPADDPNVVAKHLTTPDAIAVLPDNTALVGERTTGRILRVQPQPSRPVTTVRTMTGLDTSGDGGLLDLAISPNYGEDKLIFALVTTASDTRVVDFTLNGPVTSVLTGIPKGSSDNRGRIAFGTDERLYVGTGDAGDPSAAGNSASLAGKVLRVTDIGNPAPANPTPSSPVYTRGHHIVSGLCLIPQTNQFLEVEPDDTGRVEVNLLTAGNDFGWKGRSAGTQGPISTLPTGQLSAGGCAVIGSTLYVTSRDKQDVLSAGLTVKGATISIGTYSPLLAKRYGRLDTIVAAQDGALWITTSNKDGQGRPVADDERVLRIIPGGGTAKSPV